MNLFFIESKNVKMIVNINVIINDIVIKLRLVGIFCVIIKK